MPVGNRSKTSPQAIATVERHTEWIKLRIGGASFQAIGDHYGVSKQAVHEAVSKYLESIPVPHVNELRQLELERLDSLHQAYIAKALNGDIYAAQFIRALSADRRKLLGLDAPVMLNVYSDPDGAIPVQPMQAYKAALQNLTSGEDE